MATCPYGKRDDVGVRRVGYLRSLSYPIKQSSGDTSSLNGPINRYCMYEGVGLGTSLLEESVTEIRDVAASRKNTQQGQHKLAPFRNGRFSRFRGSYALTSMRQ